MLSIYPAIFFKESNGYSVVFPDLNHLATCGADLEDAVAMAVDCLAGYLFEAKLDGEVVPAPSSLSDIDVDAFIASSYDDPSDFSEAFTTYVSVDVDEYARIHFSKPVKKTLSIPAWMNEKAIEKNINFSKVLQEALMAKLS